MHFILALLSAAVANAMAEKEPVYGIELTMSGAVAAVSLPNRSVLPVASVEGSREHHELMAEWFELCTSVHVDHTNTSDLTERVEALFPRPSLTHMRKARQSWDDYWNGRVFHGGTGLDSR